MTNAEKIARQGGLAVIEFFNKAYYGCAHLKNIEEPCWKQMSCRVCWDEWLRQETDEQTKTY